ncbi:MAG: T9SS type A sorting domain-containing protein [Chitinophagaceae bacterium]
MKRLLIITTALLGTSLGTNAQAIGSGNSSGDSYFLCNTPGTPKVCGYNSQGELGDGTTANKSTPVSVSGLTGITAMSGGQMHTLFLKNDSTVWSCGGNNHDQLGDGTGTDRHTPVKVSGLTGIISIAAGGLHSLFLKSDGSAWACGSNINGQLGDGTTAGKSIAVKVLSDITAIAAGNTYSLFLKNDGSVWGCGMNAFGQLCKGVPTGYWVNIPVQVTGLSNIVAIAAGLSHSIFLKGDGTVWACGANTSGQLGNGTTISNDTLVQVSGLSGITAIAAGSGHSLFLKNDGSVWACGDNTYGELGDGTTIERNTPIQVSGLSGITAIAAGGVAFSLFLKSDGSFWACGRNNNGQLGDGTIIDRLIPVEVAPCSNVGIEAVNNRFSGFTVSPNPANNNLVLKAPSGIPSAGRTPGQFVIKIYNTIGQQVYQSSSQSLQVDVSSLSSGVYYVQLFDGEKQNWGKFVKD